MKRTVIDYLVDIENGCSYLMKRAQEITYEDFMEDEDLKRAFVRS